MKAESYTKNGIHPITKLASPAAAAAPAPKPAAKPEPTSAAASKLYGTKLGLRGAEKKEQA